MHLDDERVQHFVQRELPRPETLMVEAHLAQCVDCRARVATAAREIDDVNALLASVDHPTPAITAAMIITRAAPRGTQWGRWAAGIGLVLTLGGAAYAAPGSPLRRWSRAVTTWVDRGGDPAPIAPPPAGEGVEMAGVAVAPGERLLITFSAIQTAGRVVVTLTDGQDVVVRTIVGAATFTSEAEWLRIQNAGSTADYEMEVPRTAPRIEIRVGDRVIFLKSGARVTTDSTAVGGDSFSLRLALPGS